MKQSVARTGYYRVDSSGDILFCSVAYFLGSTHKAAFNRSVHHTDTNFHFLYIDVIRVQSIYILSLQFLIM